MFRWIWQHPRWGLWGVARHFDRDWRGEIRVTTIYFGWREKRFWRAL